MYLTNLNRVALASSTRALVVFILLLSLLSITFRTPKSSYRFPCTEQFYNDYM